MNSLKYLMIALIMLSFEIGNAQIKNSKTETVKIYGNCEMCENTIEKAGNLKNIANVSWDKKTKIATITYNSTTTELDEILKRIALAGYDNNKFLAPDDVYANLPECCQYDRVNKPVSNTGKKINSHHHSSTTTSATNHNQKSNPLKLVFDNYFFLKDALVKSDGNLASTKAHELLTSIKAMKMEKITTEEHTVWMKVMKDLSLDAEYISDTKDVAQQRNRFMNLTKNMYELSKVSKLGEPVYYQYCPMFNKGEGANWLSKEKAVKNPYYGTQMMTCGKTIETIE